MKTKELIEMLKKVPVGSVLRDEVIQKLLEYGELKKMITDVVDPLIEVYSYLIAVLDEDE